MTEKNRRYRETPAPDSGYGLKYVKVGGTLVYSTCTIGAEENQYNLKWFLDNYPFKLESIDPYLPEELGKKPPRGEYTAPAGHS